MLFAQRQTSSNLSMQMPMTTTRTLTRQREMIRCSNSSRISTRAKRKYLMTLYGMLSKILASTFPATPAPKARFTTFTANTAGSLTRKPRLQSVANAENKKRKENALTESTPGLSHGSENSRMARAQKLTSLIFSHLMAL